MSDHGAPPQLLFPVWSESNHRTTSMGWWALCMLPPTATRPKKAVRFPLWAAKSHETSNAADVCFSKLKETKPETFIRFWCQVLSNRDYLMTHLSCHLQYICCWALSKTFNAAGFICSHTAWDTLPHAWPHPVIWFNEQSCVTNHSVRRVTG